MRGILLFVVLLMWKMDSNPMIIQHIISVSCKVHIMNRIAGTVASWCICRLGRVVVLSRTRVRLPGTFAESYGKTKPCFPEDKNEVSGGHCSVSS